MPNCKSWSISNSCLWTRPETLIHARGRHREFGLLRFRTRTRNRPTVLVGLTGYATRVTRVVTSCPTVHSLSLTWQQSSRITRSYPRSSIPAYLHSSTTEHYALWIQLVYNLPNPKTVGTTKKMSQKTSKGVPLSELQ